MYDRRDQDLGTGRWACCFWEEKYDSLHLVPWRAGLAVQGVLLLPPPVGDLAAALGLWGALNEELGTLIEMAEEADLEIEQLAVAAQIVSSFARRARAAAPGTYSEIVGHQLDPDPHPLVGTMPASELARHLESLAEFLDAAATLRRAVILSI